MNEDNGSTDAEAELVSLRSQNALLATALRETQEAADRRLINAELMHQALKSGMVDLDGLKLIDPSEVTVDHTGDVKGVMTLIARLQRDKPWLFAAGNSSSLASAPSSAPTRNKLATEMTLEEWRAARAELLRRR